MPYKDLLKRRQYIKEYKLKNRDKILKRRKDLYKEKHPINNRCVTEEHKKIVKYNKNKRYRLKHKSEVKEQRSKYFKNNKTKIYKKIKYNFSININLRIARNLRARLRNSIVGLVKNGSAVIDLGCSIEYFKNYISNKFRDGMTWYNYGSMWHLDHIIPLCRFNLTNKKEFLEAVNYTNYQPLLKMENFIKNKY